MDTKALLGQGALIAALAFSNAVFAGSQICDDGLVGYWPLDVDGDEELRGGQGEIEGNVFFAPAIVGNGAEFDGRGAHISSGVNAAVTRAGETDISVSMWARVEPQPTPLFGSGFSALMVARSDCNIGAWQLYGGVEPASLDFNGWDNTFESFFASAGLTLPSQRWTHVVVTSTGDETTYFLDGSFAATSPVRRNAFRDIPQDIYLGWDSCSSFFAGGLDEVAVFDRALSASEVAEIFDKGTGGIPLCEAPEGPEISVSRDGRSIRSGDDDDLGVVEVATTEVSVIIANIGSDALTVGEVRLQAIENVQDLVLTAAPSSEIQAGDQSELVVSFAPISASAFAFEVSVANGDPDENPFVFTISGDANDDPTARFSAELSSSDVEVLLDNDGDGRPNPSDTIRIEGISFRIADAPFDGDVEFTFTAPAGTRLLDAFPEGLLGDRIVSFDVDPVTNRIDARFTRLGLGAFDLFDSIDLLVENDFEGQSISLQGAFLADGVFVTTDNPRTPAPNDAVDLAVGALNRIVPPEGIGSFGASVAVTDRYAAVGSPGGDGSVVIYRILGDGSRQEIGQLEAPPGTAGFGASVSISGDVLAVGSPGDPVARSKGVLDKGSVGLYQLRPAELPFLIGQVDGDDGGEFGQAVDLDGSTLVVGAPGTGADGSGAVFIFDADDLETAPVELMPTRPVANGRFGASLALCRRADCRRLTGTCDLIPPRPGVDLRWRRKSTDRHRASA
ncbi:MAG: LamG-like jellyroll fold domain-containing protein [Pseudomonadota bacterium]